MDLIKNLRSGENFHIVLWLVKDMCWAMDWHLVGAMMAVPTVAIAVWICWGRRKDMNEFLHALAVVFWITANSLWMIGEFYFHDRPRKYSVALFAAGMLSVGYYYLIVKPREARS